MEAELKRGQKQSFVVMCNDWPQYACEHESLAREICHKYNAAEEDLEKRLDAGPSKYWHYHRVEVKKESSL